jgi:RHS repeat-associated protein
MIDTIRVNKILECVKTYNLDYAADYYPYGKALREFSNGKVERYLTTQHERDQETGFDYRGARYYDSDVARFLSLDPHAANYLNLSDYSYVAGNPVAFIDPDGKDIIPSKQLNKNELSALNSMLSNSKGYRQLKKFAKAGTYEINGVKHTFKKDGKYHSKGINLHFVSKGEYENVKDGQIASGASGETNVEGKNIYITQTETSEESVLDTYVHETFIHGTMNGQDLYDDGKVNYSNVSDQAKQILSQWFHGDKEKMEPNYHHTEMGVRRVKYGMDKTPTETEGSYYQIGVSIMKEYYKRVGEYKSTNKIIDNLKDGVER